MSGDQNPPRCNSAKTSSFSCDGASAVTETTCSSSEQYRYRDYANVQESDEEGLFESVSQPTQLPRAKGDPHSIRLQKFPAKLDSILSRPEWQDIITWMPHGRSWKILKPHDFETLVMPLYFDHCNYHSFNRLVNAWSFRRMSSGPDRGSYYHELFLRGRPHLHKHMRRLPKAHKKNPMSKANEPDFYSLAKLEPLPEPEKTLGRPGEVASLMSADKGSQAGLGVAPATADLSALTSGHYLGAGAFLNGTGTDDVTSTLLNIRAQQQLDRQYSVLSSLGAPTMSSIGPWLSASSPASLLPSLPYGGLNAGLGGGAGAGDYYQILQAKRLREENLLRLLQGQQGIRKGGVGVKQTEKQARAG